MSNVGQYSVQGLDTIPQQVFGSPLAKQLFSAFLPGFSINGVYNFQIGGVTGMVSAQLRVLMHSGSHKWINDQLGVLLRELSSLKVGGDIKTAEQLAALKTQRLAALVNFMYEANSADALAKAGAKTGGYIAWSSKSDPRLIELLKHKPTTNDMHALTQVKLTWSNIMSSQAGKDVLALKPVVENGKLVFQGVLNNGGFFSYAPKAIAEDASLILKGTPSSAFSEAYRIANKITWATDAKGAMTGSILQNGVAVAESEAKALLATKLPTGQIISDLTKTPTKLLGRIAGKIAGPVISIAVLAVTASAASAAQLQSTYAVGSDKAIATNRAFIEETFAVGLAFVGGLVAGAFAGATTFGLLSIPVGIAAAVAGDKIGRKLGDYYYDNFTESANAAAEKYAPWLAPIGQSISQGVSASADALEQIAGTVYNAVTNMFDDLGDLITGPDGFFGVNGPLFGAGGPLPRSLRTPRKKGF